MIFDKTSIFEKDITHPHGLCSVIPELKNGELIPLWCAGKADIYKPIGLEASWKSIEGDDWSEPRLINKMLHLFPS
ncbi:MAG: hypothetical protein ACTSVI_01365 [Promethearchaeota archaeon]